MYIAHRQRYLTVLKSVSQAVVLRVDPDPGSQTNADPDPGQTLLSQKVEF